LNRGELVHNPPEWQVGEYVDCGDPKMIGVDLAWAVSEPGKIHRGKDVKDTRLSVPEVREADLENKMAERR